MKINNHNKDFISRGCLCESCQSSVWTTVKHIYMYMYTEKTFQNKYKQETKKNKHNRDTLKQYE